jgi:hypothetical protein
VRVFRLILALLAGSVLLAACHRDPFRPIEDGEGLRQDCASLLERFPVGQIPSAQWPKSIQALKPIEVMREQENIRIWVYRKSGEFAGGYCVYTNALSSPSTKGVWVEKTKQKGVYKFRMAY